MKLNRTLLGPSIRRLAMSAVLLPLCIGCGGDDKPANDTAEPGTDDTAAAVATPGATAPQNQVTVIAAGVETEAAASVAVFLDSLRRGDENAANGVLTVKAREELAKTTYKIEPLGTPEGNYQIGRVGFPYPEKTVALVECVWQEPAAEGEPAISMDIVCEVHQESEGWRISGIALKEPGTEETVVLDFENGAELQATIDQANSAAPAQSGMIAGQAAASGNVQMQLQINPQQPGQIPAQLTATQLGASPTAPQQGNTQLQQQPQYQQPAFQPQQGSYQQPANAPAQQVQPNYQPQPQPSYQPPQQTYQPQQPAQQSSGSADQIALPPLPGAAVQR